ncbi:mannose-1-phosphate guanyltransferase [Clostridia bacterium]|nr:mannose-1-phosphate guanyltransferase [Clostridia bacterium]
MTAIIMAGGMGERLRPMTATLPKPLVPVCGIPAAEHIRRLLAKHGCRDAVFTLHYKGGMIEEYFRADSDDTENSEPNLTFCYETEPLGTAGCVKRALKKQTGSLPTEPFLVISGDALTDFNLSEAFRYHKGTGAAATIITKEVADPREYGVVLSKNGVVTGFSEKPSYVSSLSGAANTGVYVLDPYVLKLIPDDEVSDFARDIFPKMLRENIPVCAYRETGYWCDVGSFPTYLKSNLDVLNKKVNCRVPGKKIAPGVHSGTPLPAGVIVIPPCYIGTNVTIGKNTILEGAVIGDNVTIGENCTLFNTVVHENAVICGNTAGSFTIICAGANIKPGASLGDNTVVGAGATVGRGAAIFDDVKIFPGKTVPDDCYVKSDVRHGSGKKTELGERGITGETNIDITPETAAVFGAACSALMTGDSGIIVGSDGNKSSAALCLAVSSGAASAGTTCFNAGNVALSELIFLSRLNKTDLLVHISAGVRNVTKLIILNHSGLPLTRPQERKLESAISGKNYKRTTDFGIIKPVPANLYEKMLMKKVAGKKIAYCLITECENPSLSRILEQVSQEISTATGEKIFLRLDKTGTRAELVIPAGVPGKTTVISRERLLLTCLILRAKAGLPVALPAEMALEADYLDVNFPGKSSRFYSSSNDGDDKHARETASAEPFLQDGILAALAVLNSAHDSGKNIAEFMREVPVFVTEERIFPINVTPSVILGKLTEREYLFEKEGVSHLFRTGKVTVKSSKTGDSLRIFAQSASTETAKSLCDSAISQIKELGKA